MYGIINNAWYIFVFEFPAPLNFLREANIDYPGI
jgi:hypothetical protein